MHDHDTEPPAPDPASGNASCPGRFGPCAVLGHWLQRLAALVVIVALLGLVALAAWRLEQRAPLIEGWEPPAMEPSLFHLVSIW